MASQTALTRQLQLFDGWIAIVSPLFQANREAVNGAFAPFSDYAGFITMVRNELRTRAQTFTDSQLNGYLDTRLLGKSNLINQAVGSQIRQNPLTGTWVNAPTEPVTGVLTTEQIAAQIASLPEPTPQQVEAFGPGVLPEDAPPAPIPLAVLGTSPAPEIIAAALVGSPVPIPEVPPAPVAQEVPLIPTPPVFNSAPTVQTTGTIEEVAKTEIGGLAPLPDIRAVMAANTFDPSFRATTSTVLPGQTLGQPLNSFAGIDLAGALQGALGALGGGGNLGATLLGGLQGGIGLPATQGSQGSTPGIAPGNGQSPDLTALLKALAALVIPGGNVVGELGAAGDALLNQGAQALGLQGGNVSVPLNGATANMGLPIAPVMNTTAGVIHHAPKGYVVVEITGSNGQLVKVAMWKPLARSLKLWKPRRKPPISASDWKAVTTAKRVKGKAKKLAMDSGFKCVNR